MDCLRKRESWQTPWSALQYPLSRAYGGKCRLQVAFTPLLMSVQDSPWQHCAGGRMPALQHGFTASQTAISKSKSRPREYIYFKPQHSFLLNIILVIICLSSVSWSQKIKRLKSSWGSKLWWILTLAHQQANIKEALIFRSVYWINSAQKGPHIYMYIYIYKANEKCLLCKLQYITVLSKLHLLSKLQYGRIWV